MVMLSRGFNINAVNCESARGLGLFVDIALYWRKSKGYLEIAVYMP